MHNIGSEQRQHLSPAWRYLFEELDTGKTKCLVHQSLAGFRRKDAAPVQRAHDAVQTSDERSAVAHLLLVHHKSLRAQESHALRNEYENEGVSGVEICQG